MYNLSVLLEDSARRYPDRSAVHVWRHAAPTTPRSMRLPIRSPTPWSPKASSLVTRLRWLSKAVERTGPLRTC